MSEGDKDEMFVKDLKHNNNVVKPEFICGKIKNCAHIAVNTDGAIGRKAAAVRTFAQFAQTWRSDKPAVVSVKIGNLNGFMLTNSNYG